MKKHNLAITYIFLKCYFKVAIKKKTKPNNTKFQNGRLQH